MENSTLIKSVLSYLGDNWILIITSFIVGILVGYFLERV